MPSRKGCAQRWEWILYPMMWLASPNLRTILEKNNNHFKWSALVHILLILRGMGRFSVLACFITLTSLGLACGDPDMLVQELARVEQAITDGKAHSGHPSVGILKSMFGAMCTATLVGKKTVVTAGHCIQDGSSQTFELEGQTYQAASASTHPNWNANTLENDIAVVLLSQAPSVASSAVATSAPTVGLEITLVGYGVTGEGMQDTGTKRMAMNSIQQLENTRFTFAGSGGNTGSTCYGDSGGPAFATLGGKEVQVGITSSGQKPCGTLAYDTRVDAYVTWLSQVSGGDLNQGDTEPPPPPPGEDEEPPRVVITAPSSGATVGDSITVTATITDNVGVTKGELMVDGGVVSSLSRAPFEFAVNLTGGSHTLRVSGYDKAGNQGMNEVVVSVDSGSSTTPPPGSIPGGYGAPCQGPSDCTSGLCAEDPGFIGKYCTQTCIQNGPACPTGTGCFSSSDNKSYVCGAPQTNLPIRSGLNQNELMGACVLGGSPSGTDALSTLLPSLLLLGFLRHRRR
jgi:hypothetical protein